MKISKDDGRTPQQNPSSPPDPGQNPIPGKDNPSDKQRPGTSPNQPYDKS